MLFSRGDLPSIRILMECLQEFRDVSGLAVNTAKSNIFMAGIQNDTLDEALANAEFARGHMPVRYLGIPLAAQRLSITDYSPLVDQIAGCICKWTAKSLSFAGRLELIRSVIQGVECFWLQVFPLPMAVIDKIHRLCRAFLWNSKRAPVAWEDICHPKEEDGLGIRHIQSWNGALLAESYGTFIARQTPYGPTIRHMTEWTDSKRLVTSKAYEYFRPKLPRQPWKASIWKAFIPPKYSFILWLGLRERMATRDRLAFLHEDPSCSMCINSKESAKHLFFECPFSSYVWSHIRHWFGITRRMSTFLSAVKWLKKGKTISSVQNKARHLALACTVYSLWRHRNEIIFEGKTPNPDGLVISIKITFVFVNLSEFDRPFSLFRRVSLCLPENLFWASSLALLKAIACFFLVGSFILCRWQFYPYFSVVFDRYQLAGACQALLLLVDLPLSTFLHAKAKKSKVQAEPAGYYNKTSSLPSTASILVTAATTDSTTATPIFVDAKAVGQSIFAMGTAAPNESGFFGFLL
ncbi:UNVERIFIED_CONTAM: hypothetical protein Sangu_2709100 [Sesamum angustifolium]|uniref:Reverse transcriptase zinc-binding domain-containing protein n=1 Tax=Sesamum angustifolium TaxID=2727405 RepID=A0AAW2IYW8_9LAMI